MLYCSHCGERINSDEELKKTYRGWVDNGITLPYGLKLDAFKRILLKIISSVHNTWRDKDHHQSDEFMFNPYGYIVLQEQESEYYDGPRIIELTIPLIQRPDPDDDYVIEYSDTYLFPDMTSFLSFHNIDDGDLVYSSKYSQDRSLDAYIKGMCGDEVAAKWCEDICDNHFIAERSSDGIYTYSSKFFA